MFKKFKRMVMSTIASFASRNILSSIDIATIQSTDNTNVCPEDKYLHQILFLISNSPGSITYFCRRVSSRLEASKDLIVVLKTLFLLHRLIRGGDRYFEQDIRNLWASGDLKINPKWLLESRNINDDTLRAFVLNYSNLVGERMDWLINQAGKLEHISSASNEENEAVYGISKCIRLLDRVIECLPIEDSRSNNVMQCVMNVVLRESFHVYESFCEGVEVVSGSFIDLKKDSQVLTIETLKKACVSTSNLHEFYDECKRCVNKSLEYPSVKIITSDDILVLEAKIEHQISITERENKALSLGIHPFARGMVAKISTVWVEFNEDDLQSSSFHIEEDGSSLKRQNSELL